MDSIGDRDTTRIIPKALTVAAGKADKLTVNGDGSAVREFTHVADVAIAITTALGTTEVGQSRTYNVGSGNETTMQQVIQTVEEVTGQHLP